MPSYEYVESAIIANLDSKNNLRNFKFTSKDFAKHGDAYGFVVKHFDKYGEFPSFETLIAVSYTHLTLPTNREV